MEKVFRLGYDNVVIIGNDCLNLNRDLILEAKSQLDQGKIALGPSPNGGLYLIGLNEAHFDRKAFLTVEWETENVQQTFSKYVSFVNAESVNLDAFSDINSAYQFKNIIAALSFLHPLKAMFSFILKIKRVFNNVFIFSKNTKPNLSTQNKRGPPVINNF